MNKQLFIECLDALEKQYKEDKRKAKVLEEVFNTQYIEINSQYTNNGLLHVLQVSMNDGTGSFTPSWIEWFCFENDFGKKGLEAFQDGKPIPMTNAGELWEYLNGRK